MTACPALSRVSARHPALFPQPDCRVLRFRFLCGELLFELRDAEIAVFQLRDLRRDLLPLCLDFGYGRAVFALELFDESQTRFDLRQLLGGISHGVLVQGIPHPLGDIDDLVTAVLQAGDHFIRPVHRAGELAEGVFRSLQQVGRGRPFLAFREGPHDDARVLRHLFQTPESGPGEPELFLFVAQFCGFFKVLRRNRLFLFLAGGVQLVLKLF